MSNWTIHSIVLLIACFLVTVSQCQTNPQPGPAGGSGVCFNEKELPMAESISACPQVCQPGYYRKASCMIDGSLVPQKQQEPANQPSQPLPPARRLLQNPPPAGEPAPPANNNNAPAVQLDWAAVRGRLNASVVVLQTSACRECAKDFPSGSYDCSLGYLRPKKGYWCTVLGDERNSVPKGTLDFKLYKCPIEGACDEGECCFACRPNNTQILRVPITKTDINPDVDYGKPAPREECTSCANGHTDARCAECRGGFYQVNLRCDACPETPSTVLFILFFAVLGLLAAFVFARSIKSSKKKYATAISFLASIASMIQIVSVFATLDIDFPLPVIQFLDFFSLFNLNFQVLAPSCGAQAVGADRASFEYSDLVTYIALAPIIFGVFILIGYGIAKTKSDEEAKIHFASSVRSTWFSFLLFMYVSVTSRAWGIFDCRALSDGTLLWTPSAQINCYTSVWEQNVGPHILMIIGYSLGIPLMLLFQFFRRRHERGSEEHTMYFGMLIASYNEENYFWELTVLLRKLLFVLLLTFSTNSAAAATGLSMALFVISLAVTAWRKPHKSKIDFYVELITLGTSAFASLMAMLMALNVADAVTAEVFGWMMIVVLAIVSIGSLAIPTYFHISGKASECLSDASSATETYELDVKKKKANDDEDAFKSKRKKRRAKGQAD